MRFIVALFITVYIVSAGVGTVYASTLKDQLFWENWRAETYLLNIKQYRSLFLDSLDIIEDQRSEIEYLNYNYPGCEIDRPLYFDPDREIGI